MTQPTDYPSIAALGKALRDRRVSALELATDALQAVHNGPDPHLFLHVDDALTLAQARAADALLAQGKAGPLAGIPIAHKDLFVTRGWRTTAASRMLADYVSPFDATVVERLEQAGTVSLGKLSCDEFAMGSGNENSAFGALQNPHDPDRVPGGSSGGSAAAVAAGLVLGTTGTDSGGSVRQPAAYCGVSGIKPTYGTVSRYGVIAYASSLDQAGPLARSAADLVPLLDTMSGFDIQDSTSLETCNGVANAPGRITAAYDHCRGLFGSGGGQPLAGLRIGVPREFFGAGLATAVADAIEAALRVFESLGARRVDISLPLTRLAIPAYYVIAPAEASSNLARFDGVHFGYRTPQYQDLPDMIRRSRSEALGPEVRKRILVGTYVLSHGYYDAYYLQAQRVRRMVANDYRQALDQACDVIMGPVTPNVARRRGDHDHDPIADWLGDIYTLGANLAGLPALSIPCGLGGPAKHLPIGLQIIGRHFDEGRLLALADCFQQHTDWHQHTPRHVA
ncbi:Asp-tRNA(Asn)/Glu-tRNA(Gln) amidotransferase subunit GatA [Castellaniella sp.]|uniref:Asp-tRNA(Asn)/Glu-tRNA(Gln) amidotransferase subunit GatA n=1 Tax=Castellaniella sp. TaxID=1955812 RepID=UPI003569C4B4